MLRGIFRKPFRKTGSMKISCMQHRHKEGNVMAITGVSGIDSVEDLYLKTYNRLKAVSEEAAASLPVHTPQSLATNRKLPG